MLRSLLLVGLAPLATESEGFGAASCPCVDPYPYLTGIERRNNGTASECVVSESGSCIPTSYGSRGCQPYDNTTSSKCANPSGIPYVDRPPWCPMSWCYVDVQNCNRKPAESAVFPNAYHQPGQNSTKQRLHYSYETCGFSNKFAIEPHEQFLRNLPVLRVSFPGDSGSGYTIVTTSDGTRAGSVVDFFLNKLFREYGITYEIHPISDASKAFSPTSSFTACAYEVSLNATDICIGNFWPTTARREFVDFCADIYRDSFKLVVYKEDQISALDPSQWKEALAAPWKPFTAAAWAGVVLSLIYAAITMWIVEGWTNDDDYPQDSNVKNVASSLFYSFQSFFGNGDFRWTPHTFPGRLALTALGVFSLIVLTLYTGQVTTILLRRDENGRVNSLEAAMEQGLKVCALSASMLSLTARYSDMGALGVPVANAQEALVKMDNGECSGVLLTEDEWTAARAGLYTEDDPSKHCNKIQVGDTVYVSGNSVPVRTDLQAPLSWAISKLLAEGEYIESSDEAKRDFLPNVQCAESEDLEESVRSLGVGEMMGSFIIAFGACTLAIVLFLIKEELRGHGCCYRKICCRQDKMETRLTDGDSKRDMLSMPMSIVNYGEGEVKKPQDVESVDGKTDSRSRRSTFTRTSVTSVDGVPMRTSTANLLDAQEYLKVPSLMERFFGFKSDDPRNQCADADPQTLDIMAKMLYGRKKTVRGTAKYVKSDMQLKIQDVPMLLELITKAVADERRKELCSKHFPQNSHRQSTPRKRTI
uniref:Ionotropic glutamate receptor C-terminal domain-containing protein n=2 Tax=Lotharella globosa TaxID=91324 RepID=A0A7S3Z448_9EUKA|mmetsp:Transcript_5388/g.9697  ORF Transcript_5388/g.9697 Transcript_5388/m.9697 type:complete len:760 (+) Transcript_5388:59-2338(+)